MVERRKEPRYSLAEFGLKGELVLYPDPEVIAVGFMNISVSGACVTIISDLSPAQEEHIIALIKASATGNCIPVQLIFNNVKIPVGILNAIDKRKFGLAISGHPKLATLAEKGKQFFEAVVREAVNKGASQADFVELLPLGKAPTRAEAPAQKETPAPQKEARLPEQFKDLPPKHPHRNLIKVRYDTFNTSKSCLRSLGPYVSAHYINNYAPRDSEIVKVLGGNDRLQKTTLQRWTHNELLEIAGDKDKKVATAIEDHFKQAMYAYMVKRKNTNISSNDILDIFEGKLPAQFADLRTTFLTEVCKILEPALQKRFDLHMADTNEERSKAQAEKDEEREIQEMEPLDLVKRFLWPKVMELGELLPRQKDTGRTWIPRDRFPAFAEVGGVVIITQDAFDEFIAAAKGSVSGGENPRDYFDVVDLHKLAHKTVEVGGNIRKDAFGLHLDTLQPVTKRELIMEKVIKSPSWSKYYILNKSKAHFDKAFGMKAPAMCDIIEKNMLSASPSGNYI